jgi:hypothetical protein
MKFTDVLEVLAVSIIRAMGTVMKAAGTSETSVNLPDYGSQHPIRQSSSYSPP